MKGPMVASILVVEAVHHNCHVLVQVVLRLLRERDYNALASQPSLIAYRRRNKVKVSAIQLKTCM